MLEWIVVFLGGFGCALAMVNLWSQLCTYYDAKLPYRSYDHFMLTKAESVLREHPDLHAEYMRRAI